VFAVCSLLFAACCSLGLVGASGRGRTWLLFAASRTHVCWLLLFSASSSPAVPHSQLPSTLMRQAEYTRWEVKGHEKHKRISDLIKQLDAQKKMLAAIPVVSLELLCSPPFSTLSRPFPSPLSLPPPLSSLGLPTPGCMRVRALVSEGGGLAKGRRVRGSVPLLPNAGGGSVRSLPNLAPGCPPLRVPQVHAQGLALLPPFSCAVCVCVCVFVLCLCV